MPHDTTSAITRSVRLLCGDSLQQLPTLQENSIDAVVTDPPYELGFMGKAWDASEIAYNIRLWQHVLRVLKPGGHLLAFGGTRTHHRMTCAIEDAGFEIRDELDWLYGTGFPKSLDVAKAIDNVAGAEREVVGISPNWRESKRNREQYGSIEVRGENAGLITAGAVTDDAKQWQGWGTALKPGREPIVLARKPLNGTIAANVRTYGTGALNIDACRIDFHSDDDKQLATPQGRATSKDHGATAATPDAGRAVTRIEFSAKQSDLGRWPANVILTHSPECDDVQCVPACPIRLLDEQSGDVGAAAPVRGTEPSETGQHGIYNRFARVSSEGTFRDDSGGASRFFYVTKAARSERDAGCAQLSQHTAGEVTGGRAEGSDGLNSPRAGAGRTRGARNFHPTVKPVELMRYLCRLITPPHGIVLDPFMGSGSTGCAAVLESFHFVGVEINPEYVTLARTRIYATAPLLITEDSPPMLETTEPVKETTEDLSLLDRLLKGTL